MKNDKARRVVKCTVGNEKYCLDISFVQSIQQANTVQKETSVEGIAGTVHHNGSDVPAFRLDSLLGYNDVTCAAREHVLLLTTDMGKCGLLVSGLSRATELQFEQFAPLPSLAANPDKPFFEGIADFGDVVIVDEDSDEEVDSRETQTQDVSGNANVALLLYPDGLFAPESHVVTSPFEATPLDVRFARDKQQNGQMIVFGMPHIDSFGDKAYLALSITQVLEVSQDTSYIHVPGSTEDVLGITKWRDHYVTVVDVPHILGFDSMPQTTRQRLVIARRADGQLIGFHTDVHINTVQLPLQSAPVDDIPSNANREMFRGCFRTQDQGILLVPAIDSMPSLALTS